MCQRAVLVNLPKSESLDIEFNDIGLTVTTGFRRTTKQILHGVSGCFKSGELTAIMGPSGAGKSSLLNILTGFERGGVTGVMKFRCKQGERDWAAYKKESCYIQQDDNLLPLFSVQEVMRMACDLKLGDNLNSKAKQIVIDDVLELLDLGKTKETRCDRLSGGQRKRLSIALELVDNPPVMFLDEPTTGLDSSATLQVVAILQSLARGGRTIVCTVHQPSATVYEMFDHVYLLAEGRCMYQGDAKNTVAYLRRLGLQCPVYHNPADYMIEVVSREYGDFNERLAGAATEAPLAWRAASPVKRLLYHSDSLVKFSSEEGKTTVLIRPPSELSRFWVLLERCFVQLFRDWTVTQLKLALHLFVGVLLGLLYVDSGSSGAKTVSNVCFMLVNAVYICYTSLMPAILKFPQEVPVLRKERFNNWYKLRTYYAAFLVSNIPVQTFMVVAYSVTAYFMSSQPAEWWRFGMFLLVAVLIALTAEGFGLALGTTVNPVNGTFLGAIGTCAALVFAGFLVLFNHMPRFMYYFTYTSYLRYALEAMVNSVYGFDRPNLPCPVIMKELAMSDENYWFNVAVLMVHFVGLRFIAYFTLKRRLSRL
ncbi:unnamed protein product [Trichogramma brassicae]|uniref:ABC transporter domain-containing protein n=1 Tax=Trichogramma brassicae TaxID=86971 RepID=A0A6H5IXV4_9HYME|nr:unnamed protein product [Trichogramma brassicae]